MSAAFDLILEMFDLWPLSSLLFPTPKLLRECHKEVWLEFFLVFHMWCVVCVCMCVFFRVFFILCFYMPLVKQSHITVKNGLWIWPFSYSHNTERKGSLEVCLCSSLWSKESSVGSSTVWLFFTFLRGFSQDLRLCHYPLPPCPPFCCICHSVE